MTRPQGVDRFLALACRELGCQDAHFELGGRGPTASAAVGVELEAGWRLVVTFDEPPPDRDAVEHRLRAIAASFGETLSGFVSSAPIPPAPAEVAASSELTRILDLLCDRTSANAAVVVDTQTPVLWGNSSSAAWLGDVERLADLGRRLDALGVDGPELLTGIRTGRVGPPALREGDTATLKALLKDRTDAMMRLNLLLALPQARASDPPSILHRTGGASIVRAFAGIYRLALGFGPVFSELHAQTAISRALPIVERLVDELPPRNPTPKGGRVVPLR